MPSEKQTAVQWLYKQLLANGAIRWRGTSIHDLTEQAKAMDKAQKIDAYHTAQIEMIDSLKEHGLFVGNHNREDKTDAEEWYQKVYGTEQGNTED